MILASCFLMDMLNQSVDPGGVEIMRIIRVMPYMFPPLDICVNGDIHIAIEKWTERAIRGG